MRRLQLLLRVLELNVAIGFLVLMVIMTDVEPLAGWLLRITVCYPLCHYCAAIGHVLPPSNIFHSASLVWWRRIASTVSIIWPAEPPVELLPPQPPTSYSLASGISFSYQCTHLAP